ncbi:hypothetical protein [Paraburkholderia sp. ZP32-5]|uniref:hypothetical protein n=1 Tax=Paraburkholderia sp. ZP32-5 TaxID=2883245 RepID=UPI001F434C55|nr:hypothetical protein [Paraburkholderia sp. ZP32-5]
MRRSFLAGLLLSVAATSYGGGNQAPHNDSRERNDDPVLALYDSNGTRVGPIVSYGYQDGVVLTIDHTPVFVPVVRAQVTGPPNDITQQNIEYSASQLVWMGAPGVYFDASNCAGTSYLGVSDGFYNIYAPVRPSIPVRAGANVTLYIAADSASASTPVSSFFATVLNSCQSFQPDSIELWKSGSTFDLTGHYPEPLSAHY